MSNLAPGITPLPPVGTQRLPARGFVPSTPFAAPPSTSLLTSIGVAPSTISYLRSQTGGPSTSLATPPSTSFLTSMGVTPTTINYLTSQAGETSPGRMPYPSILPSTAGLPPLGSMNIATTVRAPIVRSPTSPTSPLLSGLQLRAPITVRPTVRPVSPPTARPVSPRRKKECRVADFRKAMSDLELSAFLGRDMDISNFEKIVEKGKDVDFVSLTEADLNRVIGCAGENFLRLLLPDVHTVPNGLSFKSPVEMYESTPVGRPFSEILVVQLDNKTVRLRDIINAFITYTRGIPAFLGDEPWGTHGFFESFTYNKNENVYRLNLGS